MTRDSILKNQNLHNVQNSAIVESDEILKESNVFGSKEDVTFLAPLREQKGRKIQNLTACSFVIFFFGLFFVHVYAAPEQITDHMLTATGSNLFRTPQNSQGKRLLFNNHYARHKSRGPSWRGFILTTVYICIFGCQLFLCH